MKLQVSLNVTPVYLNVQNAKASCSRQCPFITHKTMSKTQKETTSHSYASIVSNKASNSKISSPSQKLCRSTQNSTKTKRSKQGPAINKPDLNKSLLITILRRNNQWDHQQDYRSKTKRNSSSTQSKSSRSSLRQIRHAQWLYYW